MRALVLSDVHGETTTLRWLLEEVWKQTGPIDAYIFLGDGLRDFERAEHFIRARDEHAAFYAVAGNCDFAPDTPRQMIVGLGGVKLFLTHGHPYHVKSTLTDLREAAHAAGCDVALYGHTHIPDVTYTLPMLLNPGAAKDDRCALLEIKDGKAHPQMLSLGFKKKKHKKSLH